MVISESVKIFRLTTLLIIALIIYSSILGDRELLKYSVLGVIGIAIALGFVPSFHNVVGGLFLAFNSQIRLDDFIKIGHTKGFVHQVRLRYTTIITVEGTEIYVPNSFFLYKPMTNYSQRPKRDLDIIVHVATSTSVDKLRHCVQRIEAMLQTLYIGITSHEENTLDQQTGEKWKHFSFVAMEELFALRIYCYVEQLDFRKYAMIKSEVWLAVMEITEELEIEVVSKHKLNDLSHHARSNDGATIQHEESDVSESPFQSGLQGIVGIQRI
uniref:Small Conductance Mechanosensitive Ion Channel (MscS) Family putative n=1 Tax=Albugo laibachii Nc14 TaxID=890382 RepID=F0X1E1_9STRA|nr:Small Conductance Mechanosensitive Ion Channel (MscS) Family putative [Albugo laibachii Nc14]|eukprot:CCA27619.1 Small Conductance Mechanosensitive Ion Channel (MscS) Family putative [Albugo laibachii Nc14]